MPPAGAVPPGQASTATRTSAAGETATEAKTRSAPAVGQSAGNNDANRGTEQASQRQRDESRQGESSGQQASGQKNNGQNLTPDQLKELTELKARDREVRAHEQAHQSVGGQYAGSMSFSYERGPDGAQYAVGGEVSIDVSPVQGDPQATIEKMRVVRAAAMAPAQPSGQDRAVAAQAMQTMLQAQAEMAAGEDEREGALSVFA
ncbi:MAG: hypothetical protein HLX50_22200 [Alteromonadaceae bacterium]|nr:hypothetical protein [Alteromonadaceae bacterium]